MEFRNHANPDMLSSSPLPRTRKMRTLRTIFALVLREMTTTYGKSVAGYLWALLEPVAALALMSVIFSLIFQKPALGNNFPLFFASGFLGFQIYSSVGNKVATAIQFNRPLLEFPAVTALDAILARFILNFLTQLLVIYIVMVGIIVVFDLRVHLDLMRMLSALTIAGVFTIGIGAINAYLFVAIPSYHTVWAIVNRPMFLISGIFFMFDDVPQPYRDWLWFNPLVHVVGQMRAAIYPSYEAEYVSVLYVLGLGAVLFCIGILLLRYNLRKALHR